MSSLQKSSRTSSTHNSGYGLICGMEIHVELKTASKMFCGCTNNPFHAKKPNIYTCPVCLGMPGGLPVPNKKAIEWSIKLGLALGCQINMFSKFDRKHYFYPDLPKGYQISQYDIPFCSDGKLETSYGPVRIRRIHLEEDTGKLLHKSIAGKDVTMIDFNRGGVPLVEIVSEADIRSPEQAVEYAKTIRNIIRYLDIGDCDMEKGGMRVEANLSLLPLAQSPMPLTPDQSLPVPLAEEHFPAYKVELKNINSFKFMASAVEYEMQRQEKLLRNNTTPNQETRGWDSVKQISFVQRSKENAEDYRYFPDPDIPPIRFTKQQIQALQDQLPEMPHQVQARWQDTAGIEEQYSAQLATTTATVAWVDELITVAQKNQIPPNKVISAVLHKKIACKMGDAPEKVIEAYKALISHDTIDTTELAHTVMQIIEKHPAEVAKYQAGQSQLMGFFMGQTMRIIGKKIDPHLIKKLLEEKLQ